MSNFVVNPYIVTTPEVPAFHCQEATGDNFGLGGGGGVNTKVGVRVLSGHPAIGQTVTQVKFYMGKIYGSPSGTVTLYVYNDGVDQSAGGSSINAATELTDEFQLITFTLSHTIAEDDDIVIQGGTVNDSNQVSLSVHNGQSIADQISVKYTGSWSTDNRNTYFCYFGLE